MKILAIETSCDETAISIIEARGDLPTVTIEVLANVIHSQIELHRKYGGVFPALAKREHSKNLIPVLKSALNQANLEITSPSPLFFDKKELEKILEREPNLFEQFYHYISSIKIPEIDAIAVTYGPGLEPALWVGINFAKALSLVWNKPIIPVNHMEGHIFSALLEKNSHKKFKISGVTFPILSLLISGGHTELVVSNNWLDYTVIGETRDDAVGEAFDKVARMLGLPYPGGPEISKIAENFISKNKQITLPRPMIDSGDYDFSFSGLKTAVLHVIKKISHLTEEKKSEIAYEFQEAASETLVKKTLRAIKEYDIKTVVVGGGVSANTRIREKLSSDISSNFPSVILFLPPLSFTTDNALMIALAGYIHTLKNPDNHLTPETMSSLVANGTLRLDSTV